ncbi:MAG: DciA family protein [Steroidobacteraceae bacterium]
MPAATPSPTRPGAAQARRRTPGVPHSVNQLLQRRGGLSQLAHNAPIRQSWAEWLRGLVPAELAPHLVGVRPKSGARAAGVVAELVVFADSAAWSTRLRYALVAMQPQIDAHAGAPVRISVRILMESAAAGR